MSEDVAVFCEGSAQQNTARGAANGFIDQGPARPCFPKRKQSHSLRNRR
jgi:hypothetical protein